MTENDSYGDLFFQLESGRIVSVDAFHISGTYANILEGDPRYIKPFLLQGIPAEVRTKMPIGKPLIILDSPAPLPGWKLFARLESSSGVRTNHPDFHSRLFVCWFCEYIEGSIQDLVSQALAKVDWESSAEDYDSMYL